MTKKKLIKRKGISGELDDFSDFLFDVIVPAAAIASVIAICIGIAFLVLN